MSAGSIQTSVRVGDALLRAAGVLGLDVCPSRARMIGDGSRDAARAVLSSGADARVWIQGRSGAGKSTVLGLVERALRERRERVAVVGRARPGRRAVVDCLRGDPLERLGTLCRAGLCDPTLLGRTRSELSDGERFRLDLAIALDGLVRGGGGTLVVDEFGTSLDGVSARCVGGSLSRWLDRLAERGCSIRLVAAAANPVARRGVRASLVVTVGEHGSDVEMCGESRDPSGWFSIERGTIADFDALSRHHYRSGRPATWRRVLRAIDLESGEIAGVLVTSMPTLNGSWRKLAWPGRYVTGDRVADIRRMNAELRNVSRVVVAPVYRGLGVARKLVHAYLRDPETSGTEAVAAMGSLSGFLSSAGMTAYPLPTAMHDLRLLDAFAHVELGVHEVLGRDGLGRALRSALIVRELERWVIAHPSTRNHAGSSPACLARLAAKRLSAPVVAFAHVAEGSR